MRRTRERSVVFLTAALLTLTLTLTSASGQEVVTVTVDTTADAVDFGGAQTVAELPGPDGRTTLREATIATTNTSGPETIAFAIPTTDPGFDGTGFTIAIDTPANAAELVLGDDTTTVDATTQPGGHPITVSGGALESEDGTGLRVMSSGNRLIGLGFDGYANGVLVRGSENAISRCRGTGNRQAIQLAGAGARGGNSVVGCTLSGNVLGVAVVNTIGARIADNTISGNDHDGVFVLQSDLVDVRGNRLTGNGRSGLFHQADQSFDAIDNPAGTVTGNTISGNGRNGVTVDVDRLTIARNSIDGNGSIGIDVLGGREDVSGVTRNDSNDRDRIMNHPDLVAAVDDGTATVVVGRVDSQVPQSLTIELYVSDAADPSGFGEGRTFVGTATADAKGRFAGSLPGGLAGKQLTATATNAAGTTSEFSAALAVEVPRTAKKSG